MTTGQRIKAARKKAGMTQAALAEKLGISYVNISQLEKDQRNPKLETLQRIAKALGVSISNLLPPDNYWEDESGIGHTEPQVVEHEGPLQRAEVVEHSATPEELDALLAKLQDGKPLLLSPDELAKLKSTPKEQVAAALDKAEQEEQKQIVRISAPLYKLRGISPERRERLKGLKDQAVRYEHSLGVSHLASDILDQLNAPQRRIATALGKLNEEGQEKAAERVEELTEIPRYQAPQILQAEKHVYGPYKAYTVACPICGQTLTADERTGAAYCLNCEKSFPFEYQAQEPPTDTPQDTPAPQDGTDTAPAETPPDGPQEPPEGRIQSITMICPICGQHLRGDTSTGKAYCNYCKRSFPLPQILK